MNRPLDRRQFLRVTTGALAVGVAACSSDGGNGTSSAGTDAPATTSTPSTTSASTSTSTSTTVVDATTTLPDPVASALAAPGSPGLVDEATYQARSDAYLHFATAGGELGNPTHVAAQLARAHREPDYTWAVEDVTPATFDTSFARLDGWEDTRDFDLMYLLWLLELGQGDTPMTQLSPDVIEAIRQRVIANRYRYDDPLPADRLDNLWFWSENHLIINLVLEFLAGQRYPDEVFTVTGLTGAEHMERARPDLLEWIHERGQLGFFEWHSNVYMLKNITPLHLLVEQADDPEIVVAAAMALDLCVFDMATHLQNGCYTAPRGRTYKKDKTSSLDEDTFGTNKFLFDDTTAEYQTTSDNGATYLAAGQRYRPPQLLIDIARADAETVVRERHGVFLDSDAPLEEAPVAPYGKDFDDPTNLSFWWSLGGLGLWQMARTGLQQGEEYRLLETEQFEQVALMAALNDNDPERVRAWLHQFDAIVNFGFLSEANTYAYRHPKVSLASVLDHRFGEMRDQVHAWQAAIDEDAMVFTSHPLTPPAESEDWGDDPDPGYWTGEASMPRSAQFRKTAVHIYQPAWDESTDATLWSVFPYQPFTHAFVPQDRFDEVRQVGNWTLMTKAGGHIALWSWRTPNFRPAGPGEATRDFTQPFDLVAEGGPDNVWIVEVGNDEDDGDFDAFVAAITSSDPAVVRDDAGFAVDWTSPSSGSIEFSSTGAFVVDGSDQPLADHPRHESPWGTVEHESLQYRLSDGTHQWSVDFDSAERTVS
ncbi:hypothetical protein [Ilumatobacter nonamiensis]|uniref:hypothetical protein n=1 Tax=Ilumatobacter nonamiensis TaxID=467093 RepID=UPI00034B959F|nr:hypothetical protein [Ilumatobacter nonamiensis]